MDIQKDLEKALDESLDVLTKAANGETISKAEEKKEEEEDVKGAKEAEEAKGEKPAFLKKKGDKKDEKDEDDDKEPEDAKGEKEEDEDAKGDKKDEDKDDEDAKGEKEEDEAMRGGYRKSVEETLSKSETVANAIEVSKFLRDLTKSVSEVIGDLKHRIVRLEKSNRELAGALVEAHKAQVNVIKSFGEDIASFGGRPLPRKSVDAAKVTPIEKSFRNGGKDGEQTLSKAQVSSKLAELEISGKVPMGTTTRFEMAGELSKSLEKLVYEQEA